MDQELHLEKLEYLESKISLEQEEKTIYRNLLNKAASGFSDPEIDRLLKSMHSISVELLQLKLEFKKMKVRDHT